MKKNLLTIILSVVCGLSIVCSVVSLSVGLSHINNTTINEKVEVIESTLEDLEALDTTLDGKIKALETKVSTLESELEETNTAIDALESDVSSLQEAKEALEADITSIKVDIESLKSKDTELDGKITALETTLNSSIDDVKEWVETNYATIESCEELEDEIRELITSLDSRVTALETSVDTLNGAVETLKEQVKQNKEKIEELENRINCLEGNHEWSYTINDDGTHTKVCIGGEEETEAHITEGGICTECKLNLGYDYNSETNTYEVYNTEGLYKWNAATFADSASNLSLKADIVLPTDGVNATNNWTPVGNTGASYAGVVDGEGHTITGLRINATENCAGFIGYMTGGSVKNLTFVDAKVQSTRTYVGVIAGSAISASNIENCHVRSGSVRSTATSQSGYIGGIVGSAVSKTTITNCTNAASITASEAMGVSGIVGAGPGSVITACINTGNVSGSAYVGGIIGGGASSPKVIGCASYGTLTYTAYGTPVYGVIASALTQTMIYGSWGKSQSGWTLGGTSSTAPTNSYLFSSAAGVTDEAITAMNETLASYGWKWVKSTDGGWPTLEKIESIQN